MNENDFLTAAAISAAAAWLISNLTGKILAHVRAGRKTARTAETTKEPTK